MAHGQNTQSTPLKTVRCIFFIVATTDVKSRYSHYADMWLGVYQFIAFSKEVGGKDVISFPRTL